jgi:hypothetical protein
MIFEFGRSNGGLIASSVQSMADRSAYHSGFIHKVEISFFVCNHRCLTRLRFCLVEGLFGLMAGC